MSPEGPPAPLDLEHRLEAMARRLSAASDPDSGLLQQLLADLRGHQEIAAILEESRAWLELAQDAGGVCPFSFDIASGVLDGPPSTWALFGFEPGSVPTVETWLAAIHPDDRVNARDAAEMAIRDGVGVDQGLRILRPGGSMRHVRVRGRALKDVDGRLTKIVGVSLDITDIVEAREAADAAHRLEVLSNLFSRGDVRSSELMAFLDALPTGVMLTNATRDVSYMNRALTDMWHGQRDLRSAADWNAYEAWSAATGRRLSDEDWPLAKAVATGRPQPAEELEFRRFDGSKGFMLVSATPLLDSSGATVSAVAIAQDISAWRAAETQAQFEMELLRKLGDITPDYLFVKDREGRLLYANSAVVASTGRSWPEIAGRTEAEWHKSPEEAAAIRANDERIMSTGMSETIEETYTSVGGTAVVRATKTPIRDDSGTVIGLAGVGVDVTGEHEAQERLRLLVNELNHRVKNTLAIVQAMARNAFYGVAAARPAYQAFEDRLLAVAAAHDLLSEGHWSAADLRSVIERTLTPHAGNRFDVEGEDVQVPPPVALSISMAVHELCTNAIKYGALRGDGRVRISWTVDADALSLRWVECDGPPVTPPSRDGFGSRMLRQAFAGLPRGQVEMVFDPKGVECRMACHLN